MKLPDVGSELVSSASTEYISSGEVHTIKSTSITARVPPQFITANMVVVEIKWSLQEDSHGMVEFEE